MIQANPAMQCLCYRFPRLSIQFPELQCPYTSASLSQVWSPSSPSSPLAPKPTPPETGNPRRRPPGSQLRREGRHRRLARHRSTRQARPLRRLLRRRLLAPVLGLPASRRHHVAVAANPPLCPHPRLGRARRHAEESADAPVLSAFLLPCLSAAVPDVVL